MEIETKRYSILARENIAETRPNAGETIYLRVKRQESQVANSIIEDAQINADYVDDLGNHCRVIGKAVINSDESLPCNAQYETGAVYTRDTLIGQLIVKKIIEP